MTSIETGYVRPLASLAAALALVALGAASAHATVAERGPGWCYSASEPQTILQNEAVRLVWTDDGNLVAYDMTGLALWSTGTQGRGDSLCFWPDGGMGIREANGNFIFGTDTNGTALRTHNGQYVIAVGGGGGDVFASSPHNRIHEHFTVVDNGDGTIALRTYDNAHYLTARPDGPVWASQTQILPWEKLYLEHNDDGTVSFRSQAHGTYMRAWEGGGNGMRLSFDAPHKLAHERFRMLMADRLVLDECGVRIENDVEAIWSAGWDCAEAPIARGGPDYSERRSGWCYSNAQPQTILQNEMARLDWKADGNLVAYDRTETPRWSTATNGRGAELCFFPDGGMGIRDGGGHFIWGTDTHGIALRSFSGRYVGASNGGGGDLWAWAHGNNIHERFTVVDNGDGTIALRTHDNAHYVHADSAKNWVFARAAQIGPWESFYLEQNSDQTVSLRSVAVGGYVSAWDGGGDGMRLSADAPTKGSFARFQLLMADRLVLEGCNLRIENDVEAIWSASWDCVDPDALPRVGLFRDEWNDSGAECVTTAEPGTLMQTAKSRLEWQADGNLVAFDQIDGAERWQTGTAGRGHAICFRRDGNFEIVNAAGQMIWQTDTGGVAFRTLNGHYMIAVGGGGGDVFVSSTHNQIHERFELLDDGPGDNGGTHVFVRTYNGVHRLQARGSDQWVFANTTNQDIWERFEVFENGDGTISFWSPHWQRYVSVWDGGRQGARMSATSTVNSTYERFRPIRANRITLEDCGLHVETSEGRIWSNTWGCTVPDVDVHGPTPFEQHWGTNQFGSSIAAYVGYQRYGDTTHTFGGASLKGRIFGSERTVIAAGVEAISIDEEAEGDASLEILGWSTSVGLPLELERDIINPIERTFFSAGATFWLAFVPVRVEASVVGEFTLIGSMRLDGTRVTATVRPGAALIASASLSVGLACIRAGIEATMTLIELGLPVSVWIDPAPDMREVGFRADYELQGLDGELVIFADVCIADASWTLVEWDSAYSAEQALFPEQTFDF